MNGKGRSHEDEHFDGTCPTCGQKCLCATAVEHLSLLVRAQAVVRAVRRMKAMPESLVELDMDIREALK